MWFPNRSDTNRPVKAQKRARSMKFCIYEVEGVYYPSSENKGADQLRGYREADLRLCFRLCRLLVFPWGGSYSKSSEKVQVGKDQEKAQSKKDSHSKNEVGRTKLTIRYLYHENIS